MNKSFETYWSEKIGYSLAQTKIALRSTYAPFYSHTYLADADPTTVNITANTDTQVSLNVTGKEINGYTVADLGGGETALEFIGDDSINDSDEILFSLEASSGMTSDTNNVVTALSLWKTEAGGSATYEVGNKIPRKIGTGADVGALSLTGSFRAKKGDRFQVYVNCDTTNNLTFVNTSVVIEEIKQIV